MKSVTVKLDKRLPYSPQRVFQNPSSNQLMFTKCEISTVLNRPRFIMRVIDLILTASQFHYSRATSWTMGHFCHRRSDAVWGPPPPTPKAPRRFHGRLALVGFGLLRGDYYFITFGTASAVLRGFSYATLWQLLAFVPSVPGTWTTERNEPPVW